MNATIQIDGRTPSGRPVSGAVQFSDGQSYRFGLAWRAENADGTRGYVLTRNGRTVRARGRRAVALAAALTNAASV